MTRGAIIVLALIAAAPGIAITPSSGLAAKDQRYRVDLGRNNPLCGHAIRVLRAIPTTAFSPDGDWRKWFHDAKWTPFSTKLLRHDGSTIPFYFSYTAFDLNDDDREEFVLWRRSMMHSIEIDIWYVVKKEE